MWAARQDGLLFEDWSRWLDGLHRHLVTLMRELGGDGAGTGAESINLAVSDATASLGFPAATILQEIEEVLAILSVAAATNTRDSDTTTTSNNGVRNAQPPVGWGVNLLLEVGYSYGTILDLYWEILDSTRRGDVIALDVIDGGDFTVDAGEVSVANDLYVAHILEGILYVLVQWFQVSMKHSITRGKDGSRDTALSELVRYNSRSTSNSSLSARTRGTEELAEEKGGRLGDGKLEEIFDTITSRLATLAADRSFDGASLPSAVQVYGKFRNDLMNRLSSDLEAAKLLRRRFVTDM